MGIALSAETRLQIASIHIATSATVTSGLFQARHFMQRSILTLKLDAKKIQQLFFAHATKDHSANVYQDRLAKSVSRCFASKEEYSPG